MLRAPIAVVQPENLPSIFFYTITEIRINTNALTRFCLSSSILILAAWSWGWIRTDFSSATVFCNIFTGSKIYMLFSCNCSQSEPWFFFTSCFTVSQSLNKMHKLLLKRSISYYSACLHKLENQFFILFKSLIALYCVSFLTT